MRLCAPDYVAPLAAPLSIAKPRALWEFTLARIKRHPWKQSTVAGHLSSMSIDKAKLLQSHSNLFPWPWDELGILWTRTEWCNTPCTNHTSPVRPWSFASTRNLAQKLCVARGRHLHLTQMKVVQFLDLNHDWQFYLVLLQPQTMEKGNLTVLKKVSFRLNLNFSSCR